MDFGDKVPKDSELVDIFARYTVIDKKENQENKTDTLRE